MTGSDKHPHCMSKSVRIDTEMVIRIHPVHELYIPVNAVSGRGRGVEPLKHTERQSKGFTLTNTHTHMTLAETY